jgi:hypothetical protein
LDRPIELTLQATALWPALIALSGLLLFVQKTSRDGEIACIVAVVCNRHGEA